jgi:predicted ribosome quality control (RQC) complex YloA/Tae2 family protein
LVEGKVERIHQPERFEIMIHINVPPHGRRGEDAERAEVSGETARRVDGATTEHQGDGVSPASGRRHCDLLISVQGSQPYVYLSERRSGNPQTPPAFCMLLRKHLIGARVERAFRVGTERIIRIEFDAPDELGTRRKRALLCEMMGKHSNIILLNENDVVVDAVKRIYADTSRVRPMLPGVDYTLPPPGKGIGPLMEAEIEAGGDRARYESLDAEGEYDPLIFKDGDGRLKDYYVFDINLYRGLERTRSPSVSAMLESYYEEKGSGNRTEQKCADLRQTLKARLDKLYLKKQRLLEDREKAKHADEFRVKGELITANIYRLRQGMAEAEFEPFEPAPPPHDGAGESETESEAAPVAETVKTALDPRLTPSQNAQRYFKKYAKAKTAIVEKAKQLEITERDIDFLESYVVFMENASDAADVDRLREELTEFGYVRRRSKKIAKRSVKKEYLRYESRAGLPIYVGRSGKENDELTFRKAKPDDLWLHTKDISGSHVILARSSSTVPREENHASSSGAPSGFDEASVREAAGVAAYYSKAKHSESVPVNYCLVKYVKKPSGAKPGFVIFTHNRTLYVKPGLPS